jgi:Tfp pilus assembly protein PilV
MIAAICCGAPLPPGSRPEWFSLALGIFVGLAIGVMLMAVLQRYAKRREKKELERSEEWQRLQQFMNSALGKSAAADTGKPVPRRWNGRYPSDEERRP